MAKLKLHVNPRGSKNEFVRKEGDVYYLKITAPPVDGAANAAVLKFIAGKLGVKKNAVRLISGDKSREKTVEVDGLTEEEISLKTGL